jgi:CubicO group peptidase (beta-lactamase class C family)
VRRIFQFLLAAAIAAGQSDPVTLIPQRMERFIADKTVAGTVTMVARGGKVIEFEAFGMADIEASRPMRKDTIFQIMSMTTAEDLLHVYRMMLNNGVYEGRRYLSPFSVHLMTEAQTTGIHPVGWMRGADYGLAWEVVTDPLGELAGHMKGTYGHGGAFGTQGWIDPASGLISILLVQRADGGTESLRNVFLNMAESGVEK